MTTVIMRTDMVEVDRLFDAGILEELADISPEMGIGNELADIALEMPDIHRVEPDQVRVQPPIGFRNPLTDKVTLAGKTLFKAVELGEKRSNREVVGLL